MSKAWVRNRVKRNEAKRQRRKTREPHRKAVKQVRILADRQVEQEKRTAEMAAMLKRKDEHDCLEPAEETIFPPEEKETGA